MESRTMKSTSMEGTGIESTPVYTTPMDIIDTVDRWKKKWYFVNAAESYMKKKLSNFIKKEKKIRAMRF